MKYERPIILSGNNRTVDKGFISITILLNVIALQK